MFVEWLKKNIDDIEKFKCDFFPSIDDRKAWDNVPEELRCEYLAKAEKYRGFDWPIAKASDYCRFHRDGDRISYETPHFKRREALQALVIAQCLLGKDDDTYKDDVLNGIVAICEESYWGVSAHDFLTSLSTPYRTMKVQNRLYPIVDLFAAETGSLMSWTMYLLKDTFGELTEQLWERVRYEIKDRLLDRFKEENLYWWMGFSGGLVNNWNPWIINNIISCLLICEDNTDKIKVFLWKIFYCLDNYVNSLPQDGGCDEGTSYWLVAGNALFQGLYQLYRATDGKIDFFSEPFIKKIGHYIVTAHIDKNYFINFADGAHIMDDGGFYISLYGKYINDKAMISIGGMLEKMYSYRELSEKISRKTPVRFYLKGTLERLFEEIPKVSATVNHNTDEFLEFLQIAQIRMHGDCADGLIIAAKGGNNGESHNHNDVGSFIVYAFGEPAFIDPGVETYTEKTFNEHRYELWTMQSCWHNLMTVNGFDQRDGKQFKAENVTFASNNGLSVFSADIENAFDENAGLLKLRRNISLNRSSGKMTVSDSYRFKTESNETKQHFITHVKPEISEGTVLLRLNNGARVVLEFDPDRFTAQLEEKNLEDAKICNEWGQTLYRVTLSANTGTSFEAEYIISCSDAK